MSLHLESELAGLATRIEQLEAQMDRPNGRFRVAGGTDYAHVSEARFRELCSIVSAQQTAMQRIWAAIEELVESV